MIEIKILSIEDLEPIITFNKYCFPTDCWKREDWVDLLTDERATYYAMMDNDIIAGDVFIYNWKGEQDYVKIMNLAVHPEYRGHGLAHKLLNYVKAEMEKDEMHRFCGETRESNITMRKVFENCGYRLNKVEEKYFTNPDESAYKYVLQL